MKRVTIICPFDDSLPLQVTSYRAFMPRYGMLTVSAALRDSGYRVTAYCELSGSRVHWPTVLRSDAVCFSLMSFSSHRGYAMADRVRRARPDVPIIFGGSHASVLPEDCLEHADYVVRNEGEETVQELLHTLFSGGDVSAIRGLSWRGEHDAPMHNPPRPFMQKLNRMADPLLVQGYGPRSLPFYIKDTLRNGVPRFNIAVTQASRGCPYNCRFCFVKQELGTAYRIREPELVVREIEHSLKTLNTRYVFFADNDVALRREYALELFRLLRERFGGDLDMFFFSRIFIARDAELMQAIQAAGRACIGVGIESLEPETLDTFDKRQRLSDIHECLSLFGKYDVKLQILFVFGSDTDTPDSMRKALDMALHYRVYNWGFCSLYDFPTRQAVTGFEQSLPDERFIHRDWRFYSGNFVVHYPLRMKPSTLQRAMRSYYRTFYRTNRDTFYQYHPIQATYEHYIPFLERAERGMYDHGGILRTDRLPGPLTQNKRINITFRKRDLLPELARFYSQNLTRRQAWDYLLSLFGNKS